jgi:hypothetical protein
VERRPDTKASVNTVGVNGPRSANTLAHLTDRQLLEELVERLRAVQPLIELAERHPFIRGLLRRF